MKMKTIKDVLLNVDRGMLLETVLIKMGYASTPMEAVFSHYFNSMLEEIASCDVTDAEEQLAIYHFGLPGTPPKPEIQFYLKNDVIENAVEIPPYEGLTTKYLCEGETALSDKELDMVFEFLPILPRSISVDYEKDLDAVLGTTLYLQEHGSLISAASTMLEQILLSRGFLPRLDEEMELDLLFGNHDEFFWLEDIEDATSLLEQALSILSCYRMLRDLYHLLE